MADWDLVKNKVDEVRRKYLLDKPPVNVFEILAREGFEITYFRPDDDTDEISGFLMKEDRTVYLNPSESAQRQNFTLAHELAHYFLGHKTNEYGVHWRVAKYGVKPEAEKEADAFAAELLMPKGAIKDTKRKYGLTNDDAVTLAKLFGVSLEAMKVRLQHIEPERNNGEEEL